MLFIQGGGEGAHDADALLARALQSALGTSHTVHFPRMPNEDEPESRSWESQIDSELARLRGNMVVVGHSLGGSMLLRYFTSQPPHRLPGALLLLAAPAWDGDRWDFEDLKLPPVADRHLARIPAVFFYHCRDDKVVPFVHLALHQAQFPQATCRPLNEGGHQFEGAIHHVAADIQQLQSI